MQTMFDSGNSPRERPLRRRRQNSRESWGSAFSYDATNRTELPSCVGLDEQQIIQLIHAQLDKESRQRERWQQTSRFSPRTRIIPLSKPPYNFPVTRTRPSTIAVPRSPTPSHSSSSPSSASSTRGSARFALLGSSSDTGQQTQTSQQLQQQQQQQQQPPLPPPPQSQRHGRSVSNNDTPVVGPVDRFRLSMKRRTASLTKALELFVFRGPRNRTRSSDTEGGSASNSSSGAVTARDQEDQQPSSPTPAPGRASYFPQNPVTAEPISASSYPGSRPTSFPSPPDNRKTSKEVNRASHSYAHRSGKHPDEFRPQSVFSNFDAFESLVMGIEISSSSSVFSSSAPPALLIGAPLAVEPSEESLSSLELPSQDTGISILSRADVDQALFYVDINQPQPNIVHEEEQEVPIEISDHDIRLSYEHSVNSTTQVPQTVDNSATSPKSGHHDDTSETTSNTPRKTTNNSNATIATPRSVRRRVPSIDSYFHTPRMSSRHGTSGPVGNKTPRAADQSRIAPPATQDTSEPDPVVQSPRIAPAAPRKVVTPAIITPLQLHKLQEMIRVQDLKDSGKVSTTVEQSQQLTQPPTHLTQQISDTHHSNTILPPATSTDVEAPLPAAAPNPNTTPTVVAAETDESEEEEQQLSAADSEKNLQDFMSSIRDQKKIPLLHQAAARNMTKIMANLIRDGVSVDSLDYLRSTPLHWAASKGHSAAAQFLIAHGANPNIRDRYGYSPLHLSLRARNFEMAETLLLSRNTNVNITRSVDGGTAMHLACENGDREAMQFLLKHGALLNFRDSRGDPPLFRAVDNNHTKIVKTILESLASDNAGRLDTRQWTSLVYNKVLNIRDQDDLMLIHRAAKRGQLKMLEYLLGIDVAYVKSFIDSIETDFRSILKFTPPKFDGNFSLSSDNNDPFEANENDLDDDCRLLFDVNLRVGEQQQTPLHLATANKHVGIVRYLLKMDARLDIQDKLGNTPLHNVLLSKIRTGSDSTRNVQSHIKIVEMLFDAGAPLKTKNLEGITCHKLLKRETIPELRVLSKSNVVSLATLIRDDEQDNRGRRRGNSEIRY